MGCFTAKIMIMAHSKLDKKQDKNSLEKWQEGGLMVVVYYGVKKPILDLKTGHNKHILLEKVLEKSFF